MIEKRKYITRNICLIVFSLLYLSLSSQTSDTLNIKKFKISIGIDYNYTNKFVLINGDNYIYYKNCASPKFKVLYCISKSQKKIKTFIGLNYIFDIAKGENTINKYSGPIKVYSHNMIYSYSNKFDLCFEKSLSLKTKYAEYNISLGTLFQLPFQYNFDNYYKDGYKENYIDILPYMQCDIIFFANSKIPFGISIDKNLFSAVNLIKSFYKKDIYDKYYEDNISMIYNKTGISLICKF